MENVEMEKLNRKIAEWVGFYREIEKVDLPDKWKLEEWHDPMGKVTKDFSLPNFCKSLDACFEYIVPKLGYREILLVPRPTTEESWSCWIGRFGIGQGTMPEAIAEGFESPALALCRAVEKLIDGK